MVRARDLSRRAPLSWWDALVVAAAQASACEYLLTEDLQHGRTLGGVRIVNPFTCTPDALLASSGSSGRG